MAPCWSRFNLWVAVCPGLILLNYWVQGQIYDRHMVHLGIRLKWLIPLLRFVYNFQLFFTAGDCIRCIINIQVYATLLPCDWRQWHDNISSTAICIWKWRHQMEPFSALLALCAGNSPVTGEFPHKDQWRWALMFSLICAWTNGWIKSETPVIWDAIALIMTSL